MKYLEHCPEQIRAQNYSLLLSSFLEQHNMREHISQNLLSPKTGNLISRSWPDPGMSIQPVLPSRRALLLLLLLKSLFGLISS